MKKFPINILPGRYAVCRMTPDQDVPERPAGAVFWSLTSTTEELSLVCSEKNIPLNVRVEAGWRILALVGPLEFDQVGIIAGVSQTLSEANIGLFAVSTFNTDYFLVKEAELGAATIALRAAGYQVGATKPLT
jgi:hypothetical protein